MKRVLLWMTLCCLMITTLLAVSVLHSGGNVQPTILAMRGYGVCQGKPCYLGIIPGVTTWSQIKTILAQRQNATVVANERFTDRNGDVDTIGYLERPHSPMDRTVVTGPNIIQADLRSVRIPLQAILQQYGTPCGVTTLYKECGSNMPCSRVGFVFLHYPMMRISIDLPLPNLRVTRLTPDLVATEIEMFDPAGFLFEPKTCAIRFPDQVAAPSTPWLGFASFQRYLVYTSNSATSAGSN